MFIPVTILEKKAGGKNLPSGPLYLNLRRVADVKTVNGEVWLTYAWKDGEDAPTSTFSLSGTIDNYYNAVQACEGFVGDTIPVLLRENGSITMRYFSIDSVLIISQHALIVWENGRIVHYELEESDYLVSQSTDRGNNWLLIWESFGTYLYVEENGLPVRCDVLYSGGVQTGVDEANAIELDAMVPQASAQHVNLRAMKRNQNTTVVAVASQNAPGGNFNAWYPTLDYDVSGVNNIIWIRTTSLDGNNYFYKITVTLVV